MLKKVGILFLVLIITAYIAYPVYMMNKKDSIGFVPRNLEFWQNIMKSDEVWVTRGDVSLQGWFVDKPINSDNPLIIFYGGNGQDVSGMALLLTKVVDNAILTFNVRGYGQSQGEPTHQDAYDDAKYILNTFLNERGIDKQDVVLFGYSLGSALAAYLLAEEQLKGAIFVSPFDSIKNVAKSMVPIYPNWVYEIVLGHNPFDNTKYLGLIAEKAIIIEAVGDGIVPNESTKLFYQAYSGPKKLISVQGKDHNSVLFSEEVRESVRQFLSQLD